LQILTVISQCCSEVCCQTTGCNLLKKKGNQKELSQDDHKTPDPNTSAAKASILRIIDPN
jgi:hypothetical protein